MKINSLTKVVIYFASTASFTLSQAQTNFLDGQTKLVNPTGRTLLLERDDEDSWLTFHDPGDSWYSFGIDRSDGGKLKLNYGSTVGEHDHMTVLPGGRIGFGTANPSSNFHVFVPSSSTPISAFHIDVNSFSTPNNAINSSYFSVRDIGADHVPFMIQGTGRVGIGTTSPDAKLTVKGDIHAEEVRVDLTVPGPDYVFEEDYDLPSLESLQNYIQENKHLPEVPSAAEMEANGIDVGVMNMLLLKKIEELTLYLFEQHRAIEQLREENKTIKSK